MVHSMKHRKCRTALFSLVVFSALALSAAEDSTEERFIPNYAAGDLHYLWSGRADLDAPSSSSLQVQEAGMKVPVPLFSNERTRFTAGLDVRWNGLDFDGVPAFRDSLNLYRVQVPFDFWHSFNDRWKAWGRVEPGLFTDFKEVNEDAWAVTVLALASYQFRPELSGAFGVYYSRDLGEDRVLPALGVIWKPDPHWNIGLTFPRASVAYAPSSRWLFSVYAAPGGAGWSVKDEDSGEHLRLNYTSWRAALGAECQFAQAGPATFWVFAAGGWQFGQEVELEHDRTTLYETDMDDSPFVTAGVRLRF